MDWGGGGVRDKSPGPSPQGLLTGRTLTPGGQIQPMGLVGSGDFTAPASFP